MVTNIAMKGIIVNGQNFQAVTVTVLTRVGLKNIKVKR